MLAPRPTRLLLLLSTTGLLSTALAACGGSGAVGDACEIDGDCDPGLVCDDTTELCSMVDAGAARMDAGRADDAGGDDGGGTDGGGPDDGGDDGGTDDGGTDDGGTDDGGTDDGGTDGGGADAGPLVRDAGPDRDAGPPTRDGGGMCASMGMRCGPTGIACCAGLRCCMGVPVPPGAEFCGVVCPMCAAPDTPIATPDGDRPIADLAVGDLVYSAHDGAIVAVPIREVSRTPVVDHHVMRVTLGTGAVLMISPGHPTADGRPFGALEAGQPLGELTVESAALVPYPHAFTYDILPDSDSGTYVAAGALIGSTLVP